MFLFFFPYQSYKSQFPKLWLLQPRYILQIFVWNKSEKRQRTNHFSSENVCKGCRNFSTHWALRYGQFSSLLIFGKFLPWPFDHQHLGHWKCPIVFYLGTKYVNCRWNSIWNMANCLVFYTFWEIWFWPWVIGTWIIEHALLNCTLVPSMKSVGEKVRYDQFSFLPILRKICPWLKVKVIATLVIECPLLDKSGTKYENCR